MDGDVASIWETRNAYKSLVGKTEGKGSLGRFRHICEDTVKMDIK